MHQIDNAEITAIFKAGFIFCNGDPQNPIIDQAAFINKYFCGIELEKLLKEIKTAFQDGETALINRDVRLSGDPPQMVLEFEYVDGQVPNNSLFLRRVFSYNDLGELCVEHAHFYLPPSLRKKGIAKKVLSVSLKQYKQMGVKKIETFAALEDGGFVWAKAGFRAIHKPEVDTVLEKFFDQLEGSRFNQVKRIYDTHYENDETKDKPFAMQDWADLKYTEHILKQSHWHGEIDLTDTEEFDNFKDYVSN